jgi:hypothetical protein
MVATQTKNAISRAGNGPQNESKQLRDLQGRSDKPTHCGRFRRGSVFRYIYKIISTT